MQTGLRLTLLGAPQVWLESKVVQGFRTVKTQALFYYLALSRRAHTRGALATLLWGDMPERNALVSLSKSLSNLRDLFPDYLEIDRHFVAFNSRAPYWLDVIELEAGVVAAQESWHGERPAAPGLSTTLQQLRRSVELYQGEFLAGFLVNNAPDFDAWQSMESQRIATLALHGLEILVNRHAALGQWHDAMAFCRQILRLEPWREEAHRQLMQLLVANGQRSAALVQFELCTRILDETLAVEPEPETVDLCDQIATGTLGIEEARRLWLAPAPEFTISPPRSVQVSNAHQLALRPSTLIGREQELAALRQLLLDPTNSLTTLVGPGGVGKTSLALACTELLRADFADGVWMVSFAGVDNQTANDSVEMAEAKLCSIMVEALGIALSGPRPSEVEIANFLQNKDLLLLLDNVDPFVRVAPLLARLLATAPGVHLLATSREALHLVGERVFSVAHMPTPNIDSEFVWATEDECQALMHFASVALFVQCAQRVQSDFTLTRANARAIACICHYVGGLPLGIELAATWLNTLAPDEIAAELARGLELLDAPQLPLARQRTGIRAVFERSWQHLSPEERRCAANFAVFQGETSREAVLWVTEAALPQLSALLNKSILRRNALGRYEMHPLLRHFCREKLATDYDLGVSQTRHSTYYLMLVQERDQVIKRKDAKQAIQEMRLELDNVRQAWRWAVQEGNLAVLQRSLSSFARLYSLLGLYEEANTTLEWSSQELRQREQSLTNGLETPSLFYELMGNLLSHAAAFLNRLGLFDRAIILAQAAQQLVQSTDSPISKAHALLRCSEAYWYQGDLGESKPLLAQVIDLTSRTSLLDVEPQEMHADALCLQGAIAVRLGHYKEAVACYERSLHISRALQDAYRESRALHSLGTTFRNQGHFGEARSYLEQGLLLSRQIGDMHSESRSLNSLGDIAYYLGDYMEAQRHFRQVHDIALSMGDRRSQCIALTNLGIVARDLGSYPNSRELFSQGLAMARTIGFRRGEAWALVCLSLLLHQHLRQEPALEAGEQGLRIFVELGDDVGQAYAWTEIGHALVALHKLDEATTAYHKALSLRRLLTQPHLEMEALAGLIRVDLARQDRTAADHKAQTLLAYLEANRLLGVEEPARIYWTCVQALLEARHAEKILREAKFMLEERAAAIDDEMSRTRFWKIAAHRAIVQAFAAEGRARVY